MRRAFLVTLLLTAILQCFAKTGASAAGSAVDTITVDLSDKPSGTYTINNIARKGLSCGSELGSSGTGSLGCLVFHVKLNPKADLFNFRIEKPAPQSSNGDNTYYLIDCAEKGTLGTPVCIRGRTSVYISYCKTGQDKPDYIFTSTQLVKASEDLNLRVGCQGTMSVVGLDPASVKWTSIAPGPAGSYDHFLGAGADPLSVNVLPAEVPAGGYVDYMVTGAVATTSCPGTMPKADTVRVCVAPGLVLSTSPANPVLCENGSGSITLTATATGGRPALVNGVPQYNYRWSNGQTTPSITVSDAIDYTVTVSDNAPSCAPVMQKITVVTSPSPATPVIAGTDICEGNSTTIPAGSEPGIYRYYDVPEGGIPLFTGDETMSYTTEVLMESKTYYVELTSPSGCTSLRTAVPVNVISPVNPSFVYPGGGTYCTASADPSPTLAAGVSGTFSASPSGLVIDPGSGKIDLSASAEGAYTITFVTADICSYTSTATVTITNSPNASFSYPSSPYCQNDPNPVPLFGTTASPGTFTASPVGLRFVNSSTGEIDLKNSLPGTYEITNKIETTGCGTTTEIAYVTISAAATVSAGPDQVVCSGNAVQLNGSFGGSAASVTWHAPAGTGSFSDIHDPRAVFTPAPGLSSVPLTLSTDDPPGTCTARSDQLYISIKPVPLITSASRDTICSGESRPYSITSNVGGTSFIWSRALDIHILEPPVVNNTSSLINEILTNTSNKPVEVIYEITPKTASCTGATFYYHVIVNPGPQITSAAIDSVCDNTPINYQIRSNVAGAVTFKWRRTDVSHISPAPQGESQGDYINEQLSNDSDVPVDVRYQIVPYFGSCPGSPFVYTAVVKPTPSVTSVSSAEICSGDLVLYQIAGSVAGTSFTWKREAIASINNNSAVGVQADSEIREVLNNTSTAPVDVVYTITPWLNGCKGSEHDYTVRVNPAILRPEIRTELSLCEGESLQLRTSAVYANAKYSWSGPNNFVSDEQNPVLTNVSTLASGLYTLRVSLNGCISEAATADVKVLPTPLVSEVTADTICVHQSGTLEASGGSGDYHWYRTAADAVPLASGQVFHTPVLDSTTTYYVGITSPAGCASPRVPVTVLVLNPENPAFLYPAGTYCISSPANPLPDVYAKGGGTFSADQPGLRFVSTTTGEVDLAASLPGTYVISFTAHNSCSYLSTTKLTITDKPSAGFAYLSSGEFCQSDINPIPSFPAGGSAGVFTADKPGLVFINNTTGEINLKASEPGSYTIKNKISGGGCLPDSAEFSLRIFEAPMVEAGEDQVLCSGEAARLNGRYSGSATGVLWSAPSGTFSDVQAPNAVYTPAPGVGRVALILTSSDPAGPCSAISDTLFLTITEVPLITSAASDSLCNNSTLNYRITSSVADAEITWSRDPVPGVVDDPVTERIGDVINETLTNLTSEVQKVVYRIKARNGDCESATFLYTVFVSPEAAILNPDPPQSVCSGSATLPVNWRAAAPGTTFSWTATAPASLSGYAKSGTGDLPAQNPINTGSAPATITYTVTPYFNACAGDPLNYTITVNPIPPAPLISSNSPVCSGNEISLNAQDAGAGAEYFWTGPNGFSSGLQNPLIPSATISNAGEYHLMVRINGCYSAASTLPVVVETSPLAPAVTHATACLHSSAELKADGPDGTYAWYSTASGGTSLATGKVFRTPLLDSTRTYFVEVTSGAGCPGPRQAVTATVLYPDNPAFQYPSGTFCISASSNPIPALTGSSGGRFSSSPGLVFVSDLTGEINLASSTPGTYRIQFTANVACQYESFADVTITANPSADFEYPQAEYCQLERNPLPVFPPGSSAGNFSADHPGLVFLNTSTGEIDLAKSTAGSYRITNTISGGGCARVSATFDLRIYESPVVDAGSVQPLCQNEKAFLHGSISGGVSSGTWSAPSGTFSDVNDLNAIYTPAPGISSVVLTLSSADPAGPCSAVTDTVTVRINPVLTVTSSSADSICNNQHLNYRITNSVQNAVITWSREAVAGIANTAVSNASGSLIDEVLVNNTTSVQKVTYRITASNNCEASTHTYEVYVKPTARITNTDLSQQVCSGSATQTVRLNSTVAGSTYRWTANAPDFISGYLSSGEGDIPSQNITNNGTAPASVIYTLTPYYKGCAGVPVLYTIMVRPRVLVSSAASGLVCSKEPQSYQISSPVPGTSFVWHRASITGISNTAASGTGSRITEALVNTTPFPLQVPYTITPYYEGCAGEAFTYTVTVQPVAILTTAKRSWDICSGETIEEIVMESATSGTVFTWTATTTGLSRPIPLSGTGNIPAQSFLNNGTTTATVTYRIKTTYQGCAGEDATLIIKVKPAVQTPAISNNSPLCEGSDLQLFAAPVPGAAYQWTGPNNFASSEQNPRIRNAGVTAAGEYQLRLLINGCAGPPASTFVRIDQTATAYAGTNRTVCSSDPIVPLTGSLGGTAISGRWRTSGSGRFDPGNLDLNTGYHLSEEDIAAGKVDFYLDPLANAGTGCAPAPAHFILTIAPAPTVDAGSDQDVCSNTPDVKLSGKVTIASTARWSSSGTGRFLPSEMDLNATYSLSTSDIASGGVTLTLTSEATPTCNAVQDKMELRVIPAPQLGARQTVYVFKDEQVTLQPDVSGDDLKYNWTPADFLDETTSRNPNVKGVEDRIYQLNVTGKGGCEARTEVQVIVLSPVKPPNAFSPNGDNKNDRWTIPDLVKYPHVVVTIFNRYGTKIFSSTGYHEPWDGTHKGEPVPVGVYYYVIDVGTFGKKQTGYVTVFR